VGVGLGDLHTVPGGEKEIFTLNELVEVFDLVKIHKGGAIFNKEKLAWMNKEHMRLQSNETQFETVKIYMNEYPEEILKRLLPTIIDRISSYGEVIRNGKPTVVIIDMGLSKSVWNDFYGVT
jgi:glutamyl-tRNA synthetase